MTLLEPFRIWFSIRATSIRSRLKSSLVISKDLYRAVVDGSLMFAREQSNYLLSVNIGTYEDGSFGWLVSNMRDIYDACPEAVKDQIIVSNEGTVNVNAVLMPVTIALLENFSPREWEKTTAQQAVPIGAFRVLNLVWIQILILDIAIQYSIRGGWRTAPTAAPVKGVSAVRPWGTQEIGVIGAIAKSWEIETKKEEENQGKENVANEPQNKNASDETQDKQNTSDETQNNNTLNKMEDKGSPSDETAEPLTPIPWDLDSSLREHSNLTFPGAHEQYHAKFQQLADLLELRGLFTIAFMFLCPDSSDVYGAEGSDLEIPIA
jgi:hypothetical protein